MWKDSGDSGHSGGEIFKQLTNANPNILEQCVKPAVLSTEQQPIEMMECNGKKILFVKKCQTMQESFERIGSAIEFTNSLGISSLSVPLLARHEVVRHHELVYKYWKSIVGGHKHSTAESTYVRAITVILARFSILLSKKEGSLKTFSLYLESEDNVDKAVKVLKILNKNAAYCLQPLGATVLQGNLADLFSGEKYSFEKLSVTSREFLQVKMDIRSTPPGRYQLKYIYKLHNKPLLLSYCATFTKMQRKFASETLFNQIKLEQTLYHGTKGLAVISIGDSGFDRSFSGANCECLGSGCYFAADLRYALGDTFSVPSTADTVPELNLPMTPPPKPNERKRQATLPEKYKFVFWSRVLVGRVCLGMKGMRHLPTTSTGGMAPDCAVDNLKHPGVFVVFKDAQAFPELLLVFA